LELQKENNKLLETLIRIANFHASEEALDVSEEVNDLNEWFEAACFHKVSDIAAGTLKELGYKDKLATPDDTNDEEIDL
jgi:hypothetical protein